FAGCLGLGLLSGGSRLWSWRLRTRYGLRPVSLGELEEHSPETVMLLGRLQWSWWQPRPEVGCLMTAAPVIFSYGRWQRHIIVSEGLLRSLSGEELLALMAVEIAQLRLGLNTLVTPLVLLLQLLYDLYCCWSRWGNYFAPPYGNNWGRWISRGTPYLFCAVVSQGSYLLFRGLEMLCFWSNQLRQYYSDRQGAALIGNPNTLVMAWFRLMEATAATVRAQGEIGAPLESLRLLLPLNPTQAALWGNQPLDWPTVIRWDTAHPLRYWFRLTSSHRPLGLRLQALMSDAQQWQLTPLLSLPSISPPAVSTGLATSGTPVGGDRGSDHNDSPHGRWPVCPASRCDRLSSLVVGGLVNLGTGLHSHWHWSRSLFTLECLLSISVTSNLHFGSASPSSFAPR
ncbi:MAG TPA: hypothetical protein IGP91_06710, partial [Thermosynechococcus sp. M46_R2017_013]|nr:hypothetical protein [Thermosynechococcus sp. M46_R2017_013]